MAAMLAAMDLSVISGRLTRLNGTDAVWPHHFVVLVLYDVAVPDELARRVELRPDACDLTRIRDDGVLEAGLPRLGWSYIAIKLNRFNLTLSPAANPRGSPLQRRSRECASGAHLLSHCRTPRLP